METSMSSRRASAVFATTASLSSTWSATTRPPRRKRTRSASRSSMAASPRNTFSSPPNSSSGCSSVRNPRPPKLTPRIGTPRGIAARAAASSEPSPPATTTRSVRGGSVPVGIPSGRRIAEAVARSSRTAIPRACSQSASSRAIRTPSRDPGFARIATRRMAGGAWGLAARTRRAMHGFRAERVEDFSGGTGPPRSHVEEELDVPFRPRDRAPGDRAGGEPALASVIDDADEDGVPRLRIAHDPSLADAPASDLELRLHERHDVRLRRKTPAHGVEDPRQGDEGYIDHREGRAEREVIGPQVPSVDPLAHDHARIVAERPVELSAPDVDRGHAGGSRRQQDLRESSRRGPDVDGVAPRGVDAERLEDSRELLAAAPDPRPPRVDLDRSLAGDRVPRLVHPAPVGADPPREDEGCGLRPRGCQAARDDQSVDPLPSGGPLSRQRERSTE